MERKKSVRKTTVSKSNKLDDLINKLRREVGKPDLNVDLFLQLLDQFERAPGDEKKKLQQKDQLLANSIIQVRRLGTIFVGRLVITFQIIEAILSELKAQRATPQPQPQRSV